MSTKKEKQPKTSTVLLFSIVVFIFLISVVGRLIPALIMGLGGLVYLFIIVLIFGIIIYFIGKFAKDLIKK